MISISRMGQGTGQESLDKFYKRFKTRITHTRVIKNYRAKQFYEKPKETKRKMVSLGIYKKKMNLSKNS
jgi:ribosomal protein S21